MAGGSIRERAPGLYELRVSLGRDPLSGKYRYISRVVHGGKRTAQKELANLVTEADRGVHPRAKVTMHELMDRWLEHLERLGRSPKTLEGYRSLIKHRIDPMLGHYEVGKLGAADLDGFYARLKKDGLADPTIHHYHACLSAALRQAMKWGWIDIAPTLRATPPPLRGREVRPPTLDELRSLLLDLEQRDPDLASLAYVAAMTGCRRGELCALRWCDVDLREATVTISRAISETRSHGVMVKDPKTHRSRRLALDPSTIEVLRLQRVHADERAAVADVVLSRDAYVWSDDVACAEPRRPDSVTRSWAVTAKKLGLQRIRFHDLRHFAATVLAGAGVDVRTIAGRLGHAHPAITLRTYAHFMEAADRRAAEVMGRLGLGPARLPVASSVAEVPFEYPTITELVP